MKKVLISFATQDFAEYQKKLFESARLFGIDECKGYSKEDLLNTPFYQKNKKILDQKRGGGYWLWKPYFILETLKTLQPGDILFYCDSGVEIISGLQPLFDICKKKEGLVFARIQRLIKDWTKRDCLILMGMDTQEIRMSEQVNAAFCMFMNNKKNIDFVNKWLKYCEDERIITDLPNTCGYGNYTGFVEHRHDQSILSILVASSGIEVFRDPTPYGDSNKYKFSNSNYPAILNRQQGNKYQQEIIEKTIINRAKMKLKSFIKENSLLRKLIYNNYISFVNWRAGKFNIVPGMSKLSMLGMLYGTDKNDKWHTFQNVSYLDIYEKYFSSIRKQKLNILEIGVKRGNSIKLWHRYFPNSRIFGLDINPDCKQFEEGRNSIFIGSQNDPAVLDSLVKEAGEFDIIIDDGSHINELTLFSFKYLFPHVKKGGLYIMEDLACSYQDLNEVIDSWEDELYANQRLGVSLLNKREDMDKEFLRIINNLDFKKENISSIQFWSQMAVILK